MRQITLITDGSCKKNGAGGWAAILRYKTTERILQGGEPSTTNNRMELLAVIKGLEALKEPAEVTVVTDSQYITRAFDDKWVTKWQSNGWKTNAGPVKNRDLWESLIALVAQHKVIWKWVRGHSGDPDNERADTLAQAQADEIKEGASA